MRWSRIAGVAVLVAVFTGAAAPAQAQINLTGITNLQGVNFNPVTGVLTIASATLEGTLAGIPFTTEITNLVVGPGHGQSCSVLDLELAPISIPLLGLHIDTSSICLTITARQGEGILGDLLCSLAGAGGILGIGPRNALRTPYLLNRAVQRSLDSPLAVFSERRPRVAPHSPKAIRHLVLSRSGLRPRLGRE